MELTKEEASRLIYTFGPFQLEPAEHRLVRDGRDVRLPPKVFETLVVLVERHGLLVEKDDLMKALWPGMFVEEATLAGNISLLRKALGDAPGAEESQYIETVPKRGYRFIAKVNQTARSLSGSNEAEEDAESEGVPQRRTPQSRHDTDGTAEAVPLTKLSISSLSSGVVRERIAWATMAAVLTCALVAVGARYIRLKDSAPATATVRSTILPPTGHQFRISVADMAGVIVNVSAPAISPDGRLLVTPVRDSQGRMVLWLRSLN